MYSKWRPNYSLSQNFLHNPGLIQHLVDLSCLSPRDKVLEIGAGSGQLTLSLWQKIKPHGQLCAVEIDPYLFNQLKTKFPLHPNITLINQDFCDFDLSALDLDYQVVANLPFHLTSCILNKILELETNPCSKAHLVVQKEAALMFAGSGLNAPETLKSLTFFPFYSFVIKHRFQANDFKPAPKVETVFLSITKLEQPQIETELFGHWKIFCQLLSKDRVGQGVWRKIFSDQDLKYIRRNSGLSWGRGIQQQRSRDFLRLYQNLVLPQPAIMERIIRSSLGKTN